MRMYNPPHPGKIIKALCLEPLGLSVSDAAKGLGISRKTLSAILISNDGLYWTPVTFAENVCSPNMPDGWSNIDLPKPVTARYLKIFIFSNCGDAQLLTFRGLRFD